METGAPEENERAEGEEKAAGGGEATARERVAGGEGEADGGGEEGGEGGPDKRADGKRLAGEERGERGVGTEERAVRGLAESDPSEDKGEEEQAGDDEIGATGGGAEAAGGGRETYPSEHGPQDDEDARERIIEVGDVREERDLHDPRGRDEAEGERERQQRTDGEGEGGAVGEVVAEGGEKIQEAEEQKKV